jgi:cytidine deaminase
MKKTVYQFQFEEYNHISELSTEDALLLSKAREVTTVAYAPYSRFHVGACALLTNGELVTGTNQENASYPVGICAERVLLSAASSVHPNTPITTMAISYFNHNTQVSNRPLSPCGMCRQALSEFENRFNRPIRIILGGLEGKIYILDTAQHLLPLSFSGSDLTE